MRYIAEDATLRFKFNTRRFSTGAPYTLAGTPSLAVYPEDSDTQITSGITLTVDADSKTGLHNVVIDLSTSASYAAGKKYEVQIEAGTVDGVSVVGMVIYEFYIHASGGMEEVITRAMLALPGAAPVSSAIGAVASIGNNVITAASINAGAFNGKGDWNIGKTGYSLSAAGIQAIWDAATSALTTVGSIGKAILDNWTTILGRLTSARAGYFDNLNVGGNVASSAEVTAIQNNTRVVRVVPDVIERPDAGTMVYRIELFLYDSVGRMEAPDASPTIELVDNAGNDHSLMLDSTTMTPLSTGHYRALLTISSSADLEQLIFTFSITEGGEVRKYGNTSVVVDTTAVDFTSSDRANLNAVLADTNELQIDNADGGRTDLLIDAIKAKTDNLPTSPAAVGSAMTLTGAYDLYHADIQFTVDAANTKDEYTICWFKNGVRQTSGITVPTLQVIKRADGTDLIASTTPTQIGSTGVYKHDAITTARMTAGEAAIAVVTATIEGSTRTWQKLIGRDSTA